MKIGKKLFLGFGLTIILCSTLALYSFYRITNAYSNSIQTLQDVYHPMEAINTIDNNLAEIRFYLHYIIISSADNFLHQQMFDNIDQRCNETLAVIQNMISYADAQGIEEPQIHTNLMMLTDILSNQLPLSLDAFKALDFEDVVALKPYYDNEIYPLLSKAELLTQDNSLNIKKYVTLQISGMEKRSNSIAFILSLVLLAGIILIIVTAYATSKSITNPLYHMMKSAKKVAEGNIENIPPAMSKDETGLVYQDMAETVGVIKALMADLNIMVEKQKKGYVNYTIDVSKYKGEYRKAAQGINEMTACYIDINTEVLKWIKSISMGNFDVQIRQFENDQAVANDILSQVRQNLLSVSNAIAYLVEEATQGKLNNRINAHEFSGGWANIMQSLNQLMDAIINPVNETEKTLSKVSEGHLEAKISGDYKGAFNSIKMAINNTAEAIDSYIAEISEMLNKVAQGDLTGEIRREYLGNFEIIKIAFNSIMKNLNLMFQEVSEVAFEVSSGASQISQSGTVLLTGTENQVSSIQELNAAIKNLLQKTKDNASVAATAKEIAMESKDNAVSGNQKMKKMLGTMADIESASNNIAKIISVIEEISFQTNLLALNAAVEAARAGEQGKGFAVVSDEVRNLAGKSQNAAQDTRVLIESAISKVQQGVEWAKETASSFEEIQRKTSDVSELVQTIGTSSTQQVDEIKMIQAHVSQIQNVTQSNVSVSQQNAASGQQLLSLAENLKKMLKKIRLRTSLF